MPWDHIARTQGGMINRSQLSGAGYSLAKIEYLVECRRLIQTEFEGVYRAAGAPSSGEARTWCIVLGTRSVLSYVTAAICWELPVNDDGRVHITRTGRRRFNATPSLCVHRTRLDPTVVTRRYGLEITNRRETLLDCLGWLKLSEARTLLDRAVQQSWLTPVLIERRLLRQPGRWGNRQLRGLLDELMPGAEAESERRIQRILVAAGISGWTANCPVRFDGRNYRIDIAFRDLRIAIEVEGWSWHRNKDRRDRDVDKLNALARHGWTLIVFTWEHTDHPEYVVAAVTSVLANRSAMT